MLKDLIINHIFDLSAYICAYGIIFGGFMGGKKMQPKGQQFMQADNRDYEILLYNSTLELDDQVLDEFALANSPAACIEKATSRTYDLIAIFHNNRLLKERFALVELCSILKKNYHSRRFPLLCLLPSKHRGLLEQLQNVHVEYAGFYDPGDPNLKEHLTALLARPSEDCAIEKILSGICPHINCFPISRHQEMLYCGAYQNRLVLGPHRLKHACQTINHKNCRYFKCPKLI